MAPFSGLWERCFPLFANSLPFAHTRQWPDWPFYTQPASLVPGILLLFRGSVALDHFSGNSISPKQRKVYNASLMLLRSEAPRKSIYIYNKLPLFFFLLFSSLSCFSRVATYNSGAVQLYTYARVLKVVEARLLHVCDETDPFSLCATICSSR